MAGLVLAVIQCWMMSSADALHACSFPLKFHVLS